MQNTLQKGSVRYIVFRERGKWYAVALEFNIVEAGDDPREVLISLFEAIQGYVKSAAKSRAGEVLNQKPDEEYEKLWRLLQTKRETVGHMPLVYTFGERALMYK